MEFRVLQYFLAVAREESILGAANSLHLTQPTLSRQMRELEDEVGKQLFVRGNRKITLTDDGILLRKRANEIVELVRKTESELSSHEESISGDIHIGSGEMDAFHLAARATKRLTDVHPDINFHLFSGDSMQVTELLDKGVLDFGILVEPANVQKYDFLFWPGLEPCGVIMLRDCPLAQKESIRPEDLRGLPLIVPTQFMEQGFFSRWIGEMPEDLRIVVTADAPYNVAVMVAEGMGYAICLDFDLMSGNPDSKLCFRPLEPRLDIGVYVVWKKYQVFSRAAELFLQELHKELPGEIETE